MEPIILASSSPRRKELLNQVQIPFEIIIPDINENLREINPKKLVSLLARHKVEAVLGKKPALQNRWVLGADTVVVHKGEIIGKPVDGDQAREYLTRLSGDTHKVLTGLALHVPGKGLAVTVTSTEVTFSSLEPAEIDWYVATGEWKGAAGGYRIQERGGMFVPGINGSASNVVGLPIRTFYGMLRAGNYQFNAT